jgi:hypothetical protein
MYVERNCFCVAQSFQLPEIRRRLREKKIEHEDERKETEKRAGEKSQEKKIEYT